MKSKLCGVLEYLFKQSLSYFKTFGYCHPEIPAFWLSLNLQLQFVVGKFCMLQVAAKSLIDGFVKLVDENSQPNGKQSGSSDDKAGSMLIGWNQEIP